MPYDINDIMGTDPGKGAKPSSGFDPLDVKAAAQSGTGMTKQTLIGGTIDPNISFKDFRFQPKTNADNFLLRAQDQGFWETAGKTLGNVVSNIPLDIVQGVGYLGTLLEFGDERDYSNALTRGIEEIKNPFGEVYRENPNKTFDLGDSAWWFDNLGGLVESAASFAVEGAGIAKIFGNLAKAASWSSTAGKVGSKIAQGLSAATLSYMEGAMSGAKIYEQAYNNNYMKLYEQGVDPTDADIQARHIASQAAAATVQIHTAMNLGLNLTGLNPLFREPDQAIVSWWKKNGKALPGETAEQWTARIAQAVPDGMPLKKLLGMGMYGPSRLGLEAFQEGLEEVNTQYAEHIGMAIGEGKEEKNVGSSLFNLDRYFSEILNQEGALNMALGALGGIAQTAIMDNIPVHKVIKYGADGKPVLVDDKPVTERVSSNTLNDRMNRQYFDNIKDALTKDMQWFSEKNREMEAALTNKDLATLARTRADLLSVHNLRAISMGMGDVWKQQYQDIANLDNTRSIGDALDPQIAQITTEMQNAFNSGDEDTANELNRQRMALMNQKVELQDVTEAMQKGYAQSKMDNSYREKAMKAVDNLEYLTDLYNKMQDKYTGTEELDQSGLAEHMFYRQANLFLHKQQLDQMNTDLLKFKIQVDELTLSQEDDILIKQAKDFLSNKEVWDDTVRKLNNDIARLNKSVQDKDDRTISKILGKYKIPMTPGAHTKLVESLQRRKADLERRAAENNKELSDTIAIWEQTNPGKAAADAIRKASERPALEDIYQQNRIYSQQAQSEYETAREQLSADSTNSAINKFLKENKPEDRKKQEQKNHIEAYGIQMDREIAASMDAKQKQNLVTKIDSEIASAMTEQDKYQQRLAQLNRDYRDLREKGLFKTIKKRFLMNFDISRAEEDLMFAKVKVKNLQERRAVLVDDAQKATQQAQYVPRTPAPVVQPTNTTPASTPAPNTTTPVDEQPTEDGLPNEIDFSSEMIPAFTTLEIGHQVLNNIMNGIDNGNVVREFVEKQRHREVPYLIERIVKLMEAHNLPALSQEEMDTFLVPYINALKNQYLNKTKNPEEVYEDFKAFLPQKVFGILDIVEEDARKNGFSFDRGKKMLEPLIADHSIPQNMVVPILNAMKEYIEFTPAAVSTEPEHVSPIPPAVPEPKVNKAVEEIEAKRQEELLQYPYYIIESDSIFHDKQAIKEKGLRNFTLYDNQGKKVYLAANYNRADATPLAPFLKGEKPSELLERSPEIIARIAEINKKYDDMLSGLNSSVFDEVEGNMDAVDQAIREQMNAPTKEFNEEPNTYIPPTPDSEPTTFSNASLDPNIIREEQKRFVGASNIEAVKANFNTNPYKEFDDGSKIRIVSDYTQLDPNLNTDVLIPGIISVGDDVTYEIDTNFAGEINYDTEMMQDDYGDQLRKADTFQNYLEAPGIIGMTGTAQHPKGAHANVPIKIIHTKTGRTIGYLPRADWILAKYPDTGNYRNVVDEYQDGDETVTDNVARQYGRIMKLRETVVRTWNTNPTTKLTSKVSKRGTGHIMLNREVNANTGRTKLLPRSAANLLPDSSLEIAVMKQGVAYVSNGIVSQKPVSSRIPSYLGDATSIPIAMLPSPDGTFVPVPLYTHRLGDNPSSLNTVVKVIELYLKSVANTLSAQDLKTIQRMSDELGFDIRIPSQLRDFIQQYFTYTQKFGEKDTVMTPSEVANARPEFMLDIPDTMPGEKASFIKVGTSFSGERPVYARLVNGQLDPDFDMAIRQGLQNRFKNVVFAGKTIRGINSTGEFKAPIIKKDGSVQINKYVDYNAFVKASSTTFAYGLNQVDGQYVYMANPVVQVDYSETLKSAPPFISTSLPETPADIQDQDDDVFEEPDELADLFGNGMLSPSQGSVQPLQVPTEGEQVSLELLQELRNLTPEAHRNTVTPEQALKELLERGVTVLADGHNPFYIC